MLDSKKYWEKRYKKNILPCIPSDFAWFTAAFLKNKRRRRIIDLGCGNGRDSYFFGRLGHNVTGVDYGTINQGIGRTGFVKIGVRNMINSFDCNFDVVYSRFFFHSISDQLIGRIIDWTSGYLIVESRAEGDEPVLYKGHERNFINTDSLIEGLISAGFEILYFVIGHKMAIYKGEDPLVFRIIARKL